MQNKETNEGI